MVFSTTTSELLSRLEAVIGEHLEPGWVAEPHAARLALLIREELVRWTQATYPGSTCDPDALEPDSRRALTLTIHTAPATHRVEIWGLACGDERENHAPVGGHVAHSWVIVAHLGGACANLEAGLAQLKTSGLRRVDLREGPNLSLSLWMGAAAPDGCAACMAKR